MISLNKYIFIVSILCTSISLATQKEAAKGPQNPLLIKAEEDLGSSNSNDIKDAVSLLQKIIAENNDPWAIVEAHYRLGEAYFFGRGIKKNITEAKKHWTIASSQTINISAHAWASANLGDLYLEEGDPRQASNYFLQVLQSGIEDEEVLNWAQEKLSKIEQSNQGKNNPLLQEALQLMSKQKYREARMAFTNLNQQNKDKFARAEARYYLGEFDLLGLGGEKNIENCIRLWKLVTKQNINPKMRVLSLYNLGVLYSKGNYIPQDLSMAENYLTKALKEAANDPYLLKHIQVELTKLRKLQSEMPLSEKELHAIEQLASLRAETPPPSEEGHKICRKQEEQPEKPVKRVRFALPEEEEKREKDEDQDALIRKLNKAIAHNHPVMAGALIKKIPNINTLDSKGNLPLVQAAIYGTREIAKLLLEAGANPNLKDAHGFTPLLAAVKHKKRSMVGLLNAAGADRTIRNDIENKGFVDYASDLLGM